MPPVVLGTLADEPFAATAVLAGWVTSGLIIAAVLARRGHSFRHLAALGVALGPLLLGLARASLSGNERFARPVVLRTARTLDGTERVLLAVLGADHHVTDSSVVLRSLGDRLRSVDVGVIVTFEEADEEHEDGAAPAWAVDALADAAARLDEFGPGLVLLPGRGPDAVARYVERSGADVVVIAGDERAQTDFARDRRLRRLTTVFGTSLAAP